MNSDNNGSDEGSISHQNIDSTIYTIRGQRVMIDEDLAKLYGVETKVLNQAVRRNTNRFPEGFMFQLTFAEYANLQSHMKVILMEQLASKDRVRGNLAAF